MAEPNPDEPGRAAGSLIDFGLRASGRVARRLGLDDAARVAVDRTLDSELVDELTRRVLESREMRMAIERVAESPEVRNALARQGVGLLEDVGRQISVIARRLDDALERPARRLLRRGPRTHPSAGAGVVSRAFGVGLDFLCLNALFFGVSVALALVLSLFGGSDGGLTAGAAVAGGTVWTLGGALYLAVFWTLAGQTPGMRFMRLRLQMTNGTRLRPRDSLRRLVGVVVAALPLFLGFALTLVNDRRRGLQDLIAGTEVRYVVEEVSAPAGALQSSSEV